MSSRLDHGLDADVAETNLLLKSLKVSVFWIVVSIVAEGIETSSREGRFNQSRGMLCGCKSLFQGTVGDWVGLGDERRGVIDRTFRDNESWSILDL
jgi:hypothetical protein